MARLDKDYVEWHKARLDKECFINLSAYDVQKLEYDYLKHNRNENGVFKTYSLYGYKLVRFGKAYYIYEKSVNHNDANVEFLTMCSSIEEVNGFIGGMYKAYHNRYNFKD